MEFHKLYQKVSGTVRKAERTYYIKLWDRDDWDQEGMLVLYELVRRHPESIVKEELLHTYFKVKFLSRVKDMLRKQGSQKRKFDQLVHEEIGELSHELRSPGLLNDERVALKSSLRSFKQGLSREDQERYEKFLSGERFKGKKEMQRELADYLSDFRNYTQLKSKIADTQSLCTIDLS